MNISLLYNVFLGETSPLVAARIDTPAQEMGARRMENLIPMMAGGMRKRPGTWYDGTTDGNKEARLIDWLVSDGNCIILELTAGTIRAWRNYQIIQTLTTDYTIEQIKDVQYAAAANCLWLVHSERRPIKLAWEQNIINMYYPRFKKTGFKKTSEEGVDDEIDFISENNRPACVTFESGRLCFAGTKNNPNRIYLSRAPNSQTGEERYTDFTTEDKYTTTRETSFISRNEDGSEKTELVTDNNGNTIYGPAIFVFEIKEKATNNNNPDYIFLFRDKTYKMILYVDPDIYGFYAGKFEIKNESNLTIGTFVFSTNISTGERSIINISRSTGIAERLDGEYFSYQSTFRTYIGEWYKQGDALTNPVYETKTETTENINITASHAIILEENDMHGSRIQWIAASKHFLAATERTTWNDTGEIPTPATFDMNIIEYAGSSELQARGTKEVMVFVGRSGKTLRALVWNENTHGSGYIDMDISERAAHLFSAGIKDYAIADYPYPMIWIVTKAGELISCTINIRAGLLAYARHPTDGKVEAVTVAAQKNGDIVFFVIKRGDKRNIEHLILEDLVNEDYADSHYIDAGEKRTFNEPTKIITGLQRFAGKTIRVFADGAIEPPITVDSEGKAEILNAATKVHLGLPYCVAFSPNERRVPANGTSMGKKQRIEKITLKLYKSLGGRAGTTGDKGTELIAQRFGSYELGAIPEPFTGEFELTVSGNIDTEGKLVVTHDEPVPFTLLALVERVAILEA